MRLTTLGQIRQQTEHLPDETHVLIDMGDLDMHEASVQFVLPAVLNHPPALILQMGQVWNYELDIDARIDARHLGLGFGS